jgi:hypothetical protein
MILLRATQELKYTFERLIDAMKAPVKWNGVFHVIDNYIILQGEVRSLFFHFDNRKVATNIFDIEINEENIEEITGNTHVTNVINMILYVFGKWGTLHGIRVEKNYEQLNQLFRGIMKEIGVEPEYNYQYFRFYKDGIRITYEDVVQLALEYEENTASESREEEENAGLWHKLIWKKRQADFVGDEMPMEDMTKGRLGHNFYMVGYDCPDCGNRLHMVVYPVGKEFRIETEEGTVQIARAFTCQGCVKFYTPRPEKLLMENDVYCMDFEGDLTAYEDYLELLGRQGERTSNPNYNRFVDGRGNRTQAESDKREMPSVEEISAHLEQYGQEELAKLAEQMEDGFFPEGEAQKELAQNIKKRLSFLRKSPKEAENTYAKEDSQEDNIKQQGKGKQSGGLKDRPGQDKENLSGGAHEKSGQEKWQGQQEIDSPGIRERKYETEHKEAEHETGKQMDASPQEMEKREQTRQKYEARIHLLGRLSDRQMGELKKQIEKEPYLEPEEKQIFLKQIQTVQEKEKLDSLKKRAESAKGKPYTILKRVYEEVEQTNVPREEKEPLLEGLQKEMKQQGEAEVKKLMEKMPPHMDRARYLNFAEKLKSYEGVDFTPYEARLKESRTEAEKQEISNVVNRARKTERSDYAALVQKLKDGDFLPELVLPYIEKVEEKIRDMDEKAIDEILGDVMQKDFDDAAEAYEQIQSGDFLPELKTNALEMLEKRLSKIKTDECELLVKKLQQDMQEAGIAENERHHFYPARRVLMKQAGPEETEVIEYALATYAAGNGLFEYPILVADTSRNQSGKEGFILTPEHFYYSSLLTAYGFPISDIRQVKASTGLLNRGLYVYRKGGEKVKVPYAVESKELPALAQTLDAFIHYLQEKPQSRQITYLAKNKHEKICCFRCGFLYQGGDVCPKCGFNNNV